MDRFNNKKRSEEGERMEKISYGKFVSQVEAVPIYLCWQSSCDAHWRFFLGDSLSPTVETLASDILKM